MEKYKPKILVIDDEPTFRKLLADTIEREGYEVIQAPDGTKGIKAIHENRPDILLTDMILPDFTGLKILEISKQVSPSTDVVMITGYATLDSAIKAMKIGASDYITKPVNIEELKITLKKYLERKNILKENTSLWNRVKLFEQLRALSFYNDLEGFSNALLHLAVSNVRKGRGGFFMLLSKTGTKPQVTSIYKLDKSRLKNYLNHLDRDFIMKIPPGEPVIETDKKRTRIILPLGGDTKRGFLVIFLKNKKFIDVDKEALKYLAEQASVYFKSLLDISEAKYLSYIDDLTELYNPRYLKLVVNREIMKAKENNSSFSILFLDLDHFKEVNDTYGHLIGGRLLCEVAKVLKYSVRNIDVVVRFGGDEYVIVLAGSDTKIALKIAERICRNIASHVFLGREGYRIRLTACIGVATYPGHGTTYKRLIHRADKSMYLGKESGRNCVNTADDLARRKKR